jgi:hypothetical protein
VLHIRPRPQTNGYARDIFRRVFPALVVQWTEPRTSKPLMEVRFLPRAPIQNLFSKLMTLRTLRVRGGLKLNRTLISFRHCPASLGNPKKKNVPCFF